MSKITCFCIEQGSAEMALRTFLATACFGNQFRWNTAMLICLHMVFGCFHTTVAELNSCDGGCMALKSKIFTVWPFMEEVF